MSEVEPGLSVILARLCASLSPKGGRYRSFRVPRERPGLIVLHSDEYARSHDTGDQHTGSKHHWPDAIGAAGRETNLQYFDALHDKVEAQQIGDDLQHAGHSARLPRGWAQRALCRVLRVCIASKLFGARAQRSVVDGAVKARSRNGGCLSANRHLGQVRLRDFLRSPTLAVRAGSAAPREGWRKL